MPFTFNRDKQKPSDKLGGDDFLSGIRKQFDQDRKMFFDKNPTWETPSGSGFSRGGFFDEDRGHGGLGIRSHLDDLAQRHPEFASSLRRGQPWDGQWEGDTPQQGQGEPSQGGPSQAGPSSAQTPQQPSPQPPPDTVDSTEARDEACPLRGRPRPSATASDVPAGPAHLEGRSQRSWSAPPDSRANQPQRFVSRLDFQPQPQQQPQQPTSPPPAETGPKPAAVRHIPIFVEGRDEPVLPREQPEPAQPVPRPTEPVQRQPEPVSTGPQPPPRSFNSSPQPFRSNAGPVPAAAPVAPPPAAGPAPSPSPAPSDGMARVAAAAQAIEELRAQVCAFAGGSRSDRQYALLDELLTRRLLELDDVEPAGREDVRAARRQAIRAAQDCISQLEAKVPLPANECPPSEADQSEASEPAPASDAPAS